MPEAFEKRQLDAGADLDRLLPFIAVALSAGTMIQFLLPVGRAGLAVTASDGVVAIALPVMMLRAAMMGWRPSVECLVQRLPFWLIAMTAALIIGFLVGYQRFGLQPWSAARVPAWFMLLSHVAVAAWIASDQAARILALRVFLVGAAASAGFELGNMIIRYVLVSQENCGWAIQAFGAMQNPNALAIVLLTAFAVAISPLRQNLFGERVAGVFVILLIVGIGLTASRSAWISAAAILGAALLFGWTRRMRVGFETAVGVGIVVLLFTVLICGQTSAVVDHAKVVVSALSESKFDGSNVERFYSWRRALELFMANPVFGAGFGAFIEGEYARGSTPLIIYSTPLWLLAEAGIVGAACYLGLGIALVAALVANIRHGAQAIRSDAIAALLVTAGFVIMSLTQEMLYQRCVWVVLALLIFHPTSDVRQQQA